MNERKSRVINIARVDAMINAHMSGARSQEELDVAANRAEKSRGMQIGKTKEGVFVKKVWAYYAWLIENVKHSTPQEDQNGVDFWISFKKTKEFPILNDKILPVQVKSSAREAVRFRENEIYRKNFRKKIIVIDFNLNTSKTEFKQQFRKELIRISSLYSQND